MRILIVTPYYKPSFIYGGPVNSVSKIAEALQKNEEIDITVYTLNGNGSTNLSVNTEEELLVDGVKVIYFTRYFKNNSFFVSPSFVLHFLKNVRAYDVVHVNMWWNWVSLFSGIIARIYKKKLIISPRGSITEYITYYKNKSLKRIIHTLVGKRIFDKAYFHLTSNVELNDTKKITPVINYSIVYNLIDLPETVNTHREFFNEKFTLLFLSRIHPKKGIELILESLVHISYPIVLKIAGDGELTYMNELKKLVEKLKITDKIEWLGWLDNQKKFTELAKADLFVLPSYNENFANVVVESLFVSTPVLISKEVGLSDFVIQNDLGWVTEGNVAQLVSCLNSIPLEKEKLSRIKCESKAIIMKTFSEDRLVNEYMSMYKAC